MSIDVKQFSEQLAEVVERAGASVVRVDGRAHGSSSGVVWEPGVVLTVAHALQREDGVTVAFGDGREEPATVAGRDPSTDLALLKVDTKEVPPLTFGDGENLKVGHLALRLARPGKTVRATSGIVGTLGTEPWRTRGGARIARYVESDAPYAPGFSGGPLVGLDGTALGLDTSGLLRGTFVTVPTQTLREVTHELLAHGKIRRGYLGISSRPVRLPEAVRTQTGDELGLLVVDVEPGGPGEKAGLTLGDTVLRVGGDEVQDLHDLQVFLRAGHLGETVPVKVLRAGNLLDLSLTVGERP